MTETIKTARRAYDDWLSRQSFADGTLTQALRCALAIKSLDMNSHPSPVLLRAAREDLAKLEDLIQQERAHDK